MPLDDLVKVIETLQRRITTYGQTFNETQTRVALIDPLLCALGWDVSDPEIATVEYRTDVGWADYALRGPGNKPAAVVEAKRLGSFVENHLDQAVNYCIQQGIAYAAVTDGSHWQVYRTFEPVPLLEERVLDVQIGSTPAFQCALKFLLLWRPNLATGNAVEASEPALPDVSGHPRSPDLRTGSPSPTPDPAPEIGWVSLAEINPGQYGQAPSIIKFPNGDEKPLRYWNNILLEAAEFLISGGRLTSSQCPIPVPNSTRYVVNDTRIHSDGKGFTVARPLSNGLFCEVNASSTSLIAYSRVILNHCGQDPASVLLKVG